MRVDPGSAPSRSSRTGRLLVALPRLRDPYFAKSVVLLLADDESGALGIVLNRRLSGEAADAVAGLRDICPPPAVPFWGGPVDDRIAMCVGRPATDAGDFFVPWFDDLVTASLDQPRERLLAGLATLRVFFGRAGWGPGTLQREIESGAWLVVEREPDDVFTSEPEGLWAAVLRRQGGGPAVLAAHPDKPRLN